MCILLETNGFHIGKLINMFELRLGSYQRADDFFQMSPQQRFSLSAWPPFRGGEVCGLLRGEEKEGRARPLWREVIGCPSRDPLNAMQQIKLITRRK